MIEGYQSWQGSAAELAAAAAELLADGTDDERLNERLVRYYVQSGILTRPQRAGREAVFGYRQLLELVAARALVRDGWPLAKIADWNGSADERALLDVIDQGQPVTPVPRATDGRARFPETRRLALAVNDDPGADLGLYAWLAERGVAVLRAYSTAQALALLDRARVHVVVSDLARVEAGLLNKRAGMVLAQAIRERGSDVPMVLFTLDKSAQIKTLALDAGVNYVTEQPDDLRDWLQKIGL
ncbi:response regulator [Lamprobacter modestohalophilus]|uniref:response regulator n=1 Tax=Lamprobacter modestohalophilus TaxID=1064514 RepID=UPI002ADEC6A3|nr:response regulator [Lamprobacter modestohalophilus]MEA1051674.1 response regulator [Lamprobacter modestohalophilus]